MKTVVVTCAVLLMALAGSAMAGDFSLQSYYCGGDKLQIEVNGVGTLVGADAKAWLFKYGYLRYPYYKQRNYRYTRPAASEIQGCNLSPTAKFNRWHESRILTLAGK